jgi:RNA recognition motif-containing protein
VEKLFRPFGLIVSIRVVYGKGQAVVEMAHEESARLAAAKLNGRMLLGTILHVQTKQQGEVGWNKRLLQEQTTNMQDLSAMMAPYRSVRRKFHE